MTESGHEAHDISWLSAISEHGPSLDEVHPIWVRHVKVHSTGSVSPPHRHAYCECELLAAGTIIQHVEHEAEQREAGTLFFAGPGIPHWSRVVEYPVEYYVIYFKPWVLMGNGSGADAGRVIQRFTSRQALNERLISVPESLHSNLTERMQMFLEEFETHAFGREMKLTAALNDILIDILRWESQGGRLPPQFKPNINWRDLESALIFIHENYTQPIYAREVAAAAFMNESQLELIFREAIGMSWVRYLQRYRIQQAAAMLVERRCNVTEASHEVGFKSLSHFNSTFQSVMGVTPSQYIKQAQP
jgi:AraC-like DNA-binding protein